MVIGACEPTKILESVSSIAARRLNPHCNRRAAHLFRTGRSGFGRQRNSGPLHASNTERGDFVMRKHNNRSTRRSKWGGLAMVLLFAGVCWTFWVVGARS